MRKKTFINKNNNKNKKGGAAFISNIIGDKTGYFIPENIPIEIEKGNKEAILTKYRLKKEDAEKEYLKIKELKDDLTKQDTEWYERNLKFFATVIGPLLSKIIYYLAIIFNFLYKLGLKFLSFLRYVFVEFKNILWSIKSIVSDLIHSRGIVVLVIIFIIIIIVIVSLFFGGKFGQSNPIFKNAGDKIISFKRDIAPESPYGILTRQLQQIFPVPDEYLQQFNGFKNSFNKFFGKDNIKDDIDTEDRKTITTGRNDGILHIKKDTSSDNFIYSVFKPKPILVSADMTNKDYDYNKLPDAMKTSYNVNNYNIYIPVNSDNIKYFHDMDNAYYTTASTLSTTQPTRTADINLQNLKPFITSNIVTNVIRKEQEEDIVKSSKTIYNINQIPITEQYLFSDKNSLSKSILKTKLFSIDEGAYKYPFDDYIIAEISKKGSLIRQI
jgi:preprotein translocase subunit SecE